MADSPRWCATCNAYGEHHTDRHHLFVNGTPLEQTYRVNGIDHAVRDGILVRKIDGQWTPVRAPRTRRRLFGPFTRTTAAAR